jgi:hypothetical protein
VNDADRGSQRRMADRTTQALSRPFAKTIKDTYDRGDVFDLEGHLAGYRWTERRSLDNHQRREEGIMEPKSARKPEVGSQVLFHENHKHFKAIVTAVHNDTLVNLSVELDDTGLTHPAPVLRTSVSLDASDDPKSGTWSFDR